MDTRQLGSTDLHLSVVGVGTWAHGGENWQYGWGPQADRDSIEALLEAFDAGVNWVDTAAVYGLGHAEEVLAAALSEWRKPIIVATKCGRVTDSAGRIGGRLTKQSIRQEVENSLRRLNVETIDLYQIHWPDPDKEIEQGFETLCELQEEQKIRWAGVSNFSVAQLERVSRIAPVASLQPPYSMLERTIEGRELSWCRDHQTGVVAYSPLQCGILTDKFSRSWVESLPLNDWRRTKSRFLQEPQLSAALNFVDAARSFARELGVTTATLAVAWVLQQPGVTSAIVGARKRGQIRDAIRAATLTLAPDTILAIEELWARYRKQARRQG